MPGKYRDGRDQHPGTVTPAEERHPRLGQRAADRAAPPRAGPPARPPHGGHGHQPGRHGGDHGRGGRQHELPESPAGPLQRARRMRHQQDGTDGHQDRLPRHAFEDDRAHPPAHGAFAPPVPHRAVHITGHPAGQRGVQEQGAVVVGDGRAERQPDVQRPCHQAPAPRAQHRREQADAQGGQERGRVDTAQPVHERAGALPPQRRRDQRRTGQQAETPPDRSACRPGEQPETPPERPDHEAPPVRPGSASTSL